MLVLGYLAVVGSALVALLFVADATLEKNSSPVIVTSQRTGLPESRYHNALKTLTTAPAPAPDMASEAVLAAQPKLVSDNALPKIEPAAREASAEVPRKHLRVEASAKRARAEVIQNQRVTQYTNYQQNQFDRFSIKGY
jgi:hypothetical protein